MLPFITISSTRARIIILWWLRGNLLLLVWRFSFIFLRLLTLNRVYLTRNLNVSSRRLNELSVGRVISLSWICYGLRNRSNLRDLNCRHLKTNLLKVIHQDLTSHLIASLDSYSWLLMVGSWAHRNVHLLNFFPLMSVVRLVSPRWNADWLLNVLRVFIDNDWRPGVLRDTIHDLTGGFEARQKCRSRKIYCHHLIASRVRFHLRTNLRTGNCQRIILASLSKNNFFYTTFRENSRHFISIEWTIVISSCELHNNVFIDPHFSGSQVFSRMKSVAHGKIFTNNVC